MGDAEGVGLDAARHRVSVQARHRTNDMLHAALAGASHRIAIVLVTAHHVGLPQLARRPLIVASRPLRPLLT